MPLGAFKLTSISRSLTPGESYWVNVLSVSGAGEKTMNSVIDSTGNIYSVAQYSANERGLIFKFNSSGAVQWQKTLPTNYVLRDLALDSSDNLFVCGANESAAPAKPWLAKISTTDGSITWQKTYTSDLAFANQFDAMYITGTDIYLSGRNNDASAFFLGTFARFDTSGNRLNSYSQQITSSYTDHYGVSRGSQAAAPAIVVGKYFSGSNYYALLGNQQIASSATNYYVRMSTGLQSSSFNVFTDVVTDLVNSEYFAVGGTYQTSGRLSIVKMSAGNTATLVWARHVNVAAVASGCCIDNATLPNLFVTYNLGTSAYILKYTNGGTLSWARQFSGSSGTTTIQGIKWKNNNLYVSGSTTINGAEDPMLWKIPDDGTKTGTYAGLTYATFTAPTSTSYTPTFTAVSKTAASRTNTVSDTAISTTNSTMTSTTTNI